MHERSRPRLSATKSFHRPLDVGTAILCPSASHLTATMARIKATRTDASTTASVLAAVAAATALVSATAGGADAAVADGGSTASSSTFTIAPTPRATSSCLRELAAGSAASEQPGTRGNAKTLHGPRGPTSKQPKTAVAALPTSSFTESARSERPCDLCPKENRNGGILPSTMLGPFSSASGKQATWAHYVCAVWSPEVYWDDDSRKLCNVFEACFRGRRLFCAACGGRGATIGCILPTCALSFHFTCLASGDCFVNADDYSVYCSEHAKVVDPTGAKLVRAGSTAAREVTTMTAPPEIEQALTQPSLAPPMSASSGCVAGLRSGSSEPIFLRHWRVATVTPERTFVFYERKAGRILRRGDRLHYRRKPSRLPVSLALWMQARRQEVDGKPATVSRSSFGRSRLWAPPLLLRTIRLPMSPWKAFHMARASSPEFDTGVSSVPVRGGYKVAADPPLKGKGGSVVAGAQAQAGCSSRRGGGEGGSVRHPSAATSGSRCDADSVRDVARRERGEASQQHGPVGANHGQDDDSDGSCRKTRGESRGAHGVDANVGDDDEDDGGSSDEEESDPEPPHHGGGGMPTPPRAAPEYPAVRKRRAFYPPRQHNSRRTKRAPSLDNDQQPLQGSLATPSTPRPEWPTSEKTRRMKYPSTPSGRDNHGGGSSGHVEGDAVAHEPGAAVGQADVPSPGHADMADIRSAGVAPRPTGKSSAEPAVWIEDAEQVARGSPERQGGLSGDRRSLAGPVMVPTSSRLPPMPPMLRTRQQPLHEASRSSGEPAAVHRRRQDSTGQSPSGATAAASPPEGGGHAPSTASPVCEVIIIEDSD